MLTLISGGVTVRPSVNNMLLLSDTGTRPDQNRSDTSMELVGALLSKERYPVSLTVVGIRKVGKMVGGKYVVGGWHIPGNPTVHGESNVMWIP